MVVSVSSVGSLRPPSNIVIVVRLNPVRAARSHTPSRNAALAIRHGTAASLISVKCSPYRHLAQCQCHSLFGDAPQTRDVKTKLSVAVVAATTIATTAPAAAEFGIARR
jgi:hypothetical protein